MCRRIHGLVHYKAFHNWNPRHREMDKCDLHGVHPWPTWYCIKRPLPSNVKINPFCKYDMIISITGWLFPYHMSQSALNSTSEHTGRSTSLPTKQKPINSLADTSHWAVWFKALAPGNIFLHLALCTSLLFFFLPKQMDPTACHTASTSMAPSCCDVQMESFCK